MTRAILLKLMMTVIVIVFAVPAFLWAIGMVWFSHD